MIKLNEFWLMFPFYIPFHCVKSVRIRELFWSAFFNILTEYEKTLRMSSHSVRMRENADQNNFEYEHFSCSVCFPGVKHGKICLKWVYPILPWANPVEEPRSNYSSRSFGIVAKFRFYYLVNSMNFNRWNICCTKLC